MRPLIYCIAIALAGVTTAIQAQVFKCAAPGGKTVYSDQPCDSRSAGGMIERQRTQEEIYREREQAYTTETLKQQRYMAERDRELMEQTRQPIQAPTVRHSGNDWQKRKDLENARTSAGSIMNNGGRWDGAAEAERARVQQEEARRRAAKAAAEMAQQEAAQPKPTRITSCIGYNCWDDQGGTYNRATGSDNLMIGPKGQQCRWFAPTKQWQCQ